MLRRFATAARTAPAPQTLVERIAQKHARELPFADYLVRQGDFVSIEPHHVMTHDNTGAVMSKFKAIGARRFKTPSQAVFTLDHDVQNTSEKNLAKYAGIGAFAAQHGVDFYPAGTGIGHQTMVEQGYAWPLTMAVASDSHSNMYGGVGCLGTPIVRTDAAAIWATGRTWWQVPPVASVELTGKLPPNCTGKDVIVALCGLLNKDEVLNHAIEFSGSGAASLTIDERLTIANMTTEWGALAGIFPVDSTTLEYYENRIKIVGDKHPRINTGALRQLEREVVPIHQDAKYAKRITFDLSSLSPHVSGPNSVKIATPLGQLEAQDIKIHKAYLLSCVNSRQSDIKAAAEVMKGHKVAPDVEFYIAPASKEVQRDAELAGDWGILVEAGARVLPAGCGPCIGLGAGLLKDGENGISATNRNFKGRMGSRSAQAYLASPAVVAASAITGKISSPDSVVGRTGKSASPTASPKFSVSIPKPSQVSEATAVLQPTIAGFPATHSGELLFLPADNLDTDGIYPGAFTYQDDIPPAEMAKIAMRNYDPTFGTQLRPNDVVVGGFNFGTGSSREQAATCLLYAGVRLILAGSLSETYKRNAINNGLLCLEAPEIVEMLTAEVGGRGPGKGTLRTGWKCEVEFGAGRITLTKGDVVKTFSVPVVGKAAQELIVVGGLENWVKTQIAE
ncbi:mitochondrial Homoaconitase [Entophlyctis luteolus]|nr:mitochondrial Homoaconitase [Entophlyctis luteolus]